MDPRPSLRRQLTRWLIGPLLALIAISGGVSYVIALEAANHAYDTALLDPARAIAKHVQQHPIDFAKNLAEVVIDAVRVDSQDEVYSQVVDPYGNIFPPSPALPPPPDPLAADEYRFYNTRLQGVRVRVVAVATQLPRGLAIIKVAETTVKRDNLVAQVLIASTLPALVIAAAVVVLLWYGIGRGLAPLKRLRDEIDARSPHDLGPVIESDKPQEVQPLVHALNQLLTRLQAAIANQQRFIANAAHQLRTPIAGLRTHSELALRQPAPAELRSLIEFLHDETERTAHLINRLLALARAEPGGNEARLPVNLHEVASRAVPEWVPRAMAKDIDLGFELDDAWTLGEPLLLRELLANLLDNAIAYTPGGGSITVRTRNDRHRALLEVEDNGPGIPEMERSKVFERFYRMPGTSGAGCGLGLSIVSEIADRHEAHIEILARDAGPGTLFRFSFPEMQPRMAASAPLRKTA